MFFPLHILRRHLVWIISAKRFYTVSDKFCLVDHSNACLEAVRAGIDASKTVRQSQILVSSFPQCCLLLACGCLMLEFFSWLPPDCWFGVGLPHRFITYARLLWKPSARASVWGVLGSLRYSFCSHTYPRMPWMAIRNFIKRNHCIMLSCVGHSQSRLTSLFAPKPVTTA